MRSWLVARQTFSIGVPSPKDLATVLPACGTTARRLRRDQRLPLSVKMAVAVAGLLMLSPIDLIPEFVLVSDRSATSL